MTNDENGVIAKSVCGRVWPQTDVLQSERRYYLPPTLGPGLPGARRIAGTCRGRVFALR